MDNFLTWMNLFLVLSLFGMLATLGKKLDILQRRVDSIATHLNVQPSAVVPPEVLGLLQAGRKIEAIKVYRKAPVPGWSRPRRLWSGWNAMRRPREGSSERDGHK